MALDLDNIGAMTPRELYESLKELVYHDEYRVRELSFGSSNYELEKGCTRIHLYRYLEGVTFVLTLTYTPVSGPERVLKFVDQVQDGCFFCIGNLSSLNPR